MGQCVCVGSFTVLYVGIMVSGEVRIPPGLGPRICLLFCATSSPGWMLCLYSMKHWPAEQLRHPDSYDTMKSIVATLLCLSAHSALGFTCVQSFTPPKRLVSNKNTPQDPISSKSFSSNLSMVDNNVLMGGGIAVAGLVAGIGLVTFAEGMGERSKARGGGLSEDMAMKITGGLMEDVEVSSISDLSSLTEKLEAALKQTGGADEKDLAMSEEDKKRIAEEADDGW